MKISPVAQSALAPTQTNVQDHGSVSVSRKEAAKAAFQGRIVESETPVDPQIAAAKANIRKIRMRTNVSPDRIEQPLEPDTTNVVQNSEPTADVVPDQMPENGNPDAGSDAEPVTEVTKPLSPQFAALARQKRALQVKEREIADRERALASQTAQAGGGDVLGRLKSNPLAVLQEAGVTYDQLTEAILANPAGSNSELIALKEEIKALKEGFDQKLTTRDQQARTEAKAAMLDTVNAMVREGDDFEMIRETGSQRDVVSLIENIYDKEGKLLNEEDAAILIENQLLKDAEKIAKIKKLQSRLAPAESQLANQAQAQPQERQMRTITNRDGIMPALSRRERALRAFRGEKQK